VQGYILDKLCGKEQPIVEDAKQTKLAEI